MLNQMKKKLSRSSVLMTRFATACRRDNLASA